MKEKETLLKETLTTTTTTTTTSTTKPNYVYTETDYFLAVKSKTGKAKIQSILLRMESEDGGAASFTLQSNNEEETSNCQSESSRGIVISPKSSSSLWNHSIRTKLYHLYDHVNVDVTVVMEDGKVAHSHFKFYTIPQLPLIVEEVVPKPSRALQGGDVTDCYLCGSPDLYIAKEGLEVDFLGETFTCRDLEYASFFFPPVLCRQATIVAEACGCSVTVAPTPLEQPLETFAPTITAYPTVTNLPTFSEPCYICGDETLRLDPALQPLETITLGGFVYSCQEYEDGGLRGLIDLNLCQTVQDIIATTGSCTCIPMFTPEPQTPAPTPTAPTTRLPTIRPTDAPPSMAPIQRTVTTFEPTVSGFEGECSEETECTEGFLGLLARFGLVTKYQMIIESSDEGSSLCVSLCVLSLFVDRRKEGGWQCGKC